MDVSRTESRSVACPLCKAEAGQLCRGKKGHRRQASHRERQVAYRRTHGGLPERQSWLEMRARYGFNCPSCGERFETGTIAFFNGREPRGERMLCHGCHQTVEGLRRLDAEYIERLRDQAG